MASMTWVQIQDESLWIPHGPILFREGHLGLGYG